MSTSPLFQTAISIQMFFSQRFLVISQKAHHHHIKSDISWIHI